MMQELICAICEEEYSQEKLPRRFPKCGHTYCSLCAFQLFNENNGRLTIVCPQDDTEIIVLNKNIQCLPVNIELLQLCEQKLITKQNKINTVKQNPVHYKINLVDTSTEQTNELIQCITQTKNQQDYTNKNAPPNIILNNQFCLIHSRAFEIMCINCQISICTQCALFGKHKGHDFKSLKQVQVNINKQYQELVGLYQKSLKYIEDIKAPDNLKKLGQNLQKKKKQLVVQINKKFEELINALNAQKLRCINKLDVQISNIQEKYNLQFKNIFTKENIYSNWNQSTKQIISTTKQNKKISSTVAQKFSQLIKQGKPIILELQKINQYLDTERSILSNSMNIKFSREVQQQLKQFMKIQTSVESKELKNKSFKDYYQIILKPNEATKINKQQNSNEHIHQQLLIEDFHNKKKQELPQIFSPVQKIKCSMSYNQLPGIYKNPSDKLLTTSSINQLKKKDTIEETPTHIALTNLLNPDLRKTRRQNPKNNLKESSFTSTSMIFQKSNGLLKKKTPVIKIKLPEKYQKTLEAIMTDQLQILDLTNAELGDQTIIEIMSLISEKIKTIKLIRNKITDEGFIKIFPFLKNISTLNLAQNFLTDKAVDILKENISKMPNLRNLILSQNRIKERNVKNRIEEIKRYNVVVSL